MSRLTAFLGRLGLTTQSQARAQLDQLRAQAWAAMRNLQTAQDSHITSQWQGTPQHLNVYLASGLRKARSRSRQAAINNGHARKFVRMCHTNILGPQGVRLQAQLTKRGGELATSANTAIESARKRWGKLGHCDITGRYSWRDIERLVLNHLVIDGEFLLRLVDGAGPHRFQVQVLDPALLDEELHRDLPGGAKIRMGIEFDAEGRILAYHIRRETSGSPDGYGYGNHARVPAAEIIHDFIVEQADQLRGIPWMNATLEDLYQLGDFNRSALAASRNAAKRAGFIHSADGSAPPGFAEPETDGEGGKPKYAPTQEGQFDLLPEGYTFTPFESKFPDVSQGEFNKACLRTAANGLGVSYVTYGNDLEAVNYSSARVGVFDEREVWKELQAWLIEHLHERVDARWLRMALVAEPLLYSLNPARMQEYLDALLRKPRRWPALDPLKEAQADDLRLRNRTTSRTRIADRDGDEIDELAAEIQREEQLLGPLPTAAGASATAPNEDTDATADQAAATAATAGKAAGRAAGALRLAVSRAQE